MKYDKKKTIILCILFALIICFLIVVLNNDNNDNKEGAGSINLVNDASEFYTVSSCLSKFVTYVSSNDNEKVYIMLDSNYIKNNNITIDNVFQFINVYDGEYTQSAVRMYSEKINSYMTRYYVKYVINRSVLDTVTEDIVQYAIVILNEKNLSFSVKPYDGEMFINE